jgi:hypothetical protein
MNTTVKAYTLPQCKVCAYVKNELNKLINLIEIDCDTNSKICDELEDHYNCEHYPVIEIITESEDDISVDIVFIVDSYSELGTKIITSEKSYNPKTNKATQKTQTAIHKVYSKDLLVQSVKKILSL